MVLINNINLSNYRNFKNTNILFDKKLNIFFGDNGSGKTNILESLSLISKGRGFRNSNLTNLIKKNNINFFINSQIEIKKNLYDVNISTKQIEDRMKKTIKLNDDSSKESIDFLNNSLSFLIFLPEMERLFQSSPSYRRNFIDRLIFSEMNDYNKIINKYKKNILERSKILQQNIIDENWLTSVETQIIELGLKIYKLRNLKLENLNDQIRKLNYDNNYQFDILLSIKDNFFNKNIDNETYLNDLKNSRQYDKQFGGSKIGPHKSDIIATINNEFDAAQLSTGQQKTVVLMMLLAQSDFLINLKKIKPILLLDEICSHLDSGNRQILLDMINTFNIQLFLTGTDKSLFSFISTNAKYYNITKI